MVQLTGADDDFVPGITHAVIAFQKSNALDADGVVECLTWEVLNSGSAVANTNTAPALVQGNIGEYVKKPQTYLINLGYSCGNSSTDGTFGTSTYHAVVAFQKKNALSADGIVGGNTWKSLMSPDAIENDHSSDLLKFSSRSDATKKLQELLVYSWSTVVVPAVLTASITEPAV